MSGEVRMSTEAWLDVSAFSCPQCHMCYVEASWYASEIGSDVECGRCHATFNTKKNLTDRVLLRFQLDEQGKLVNVAFSSDQNRASEEQERSSGRGREF
ncbi:MAG TPA: hypothetical protein VEG31_03390 [Thermoproteota archaeon]|nr:hypothetical protein [Thermoproteota archaeon]